MEQENTGQAGSSGPIPAYVSFVTFKNFIERMSKHMPTRVDSSVLSYLSGSSQSQLMTALKFLCLISATGEPTANLKKLVAAYGKAEWKQAIRDSLLDAYDFIIGNLDLDHATAKELMDAFRDRGGGGASVAEKSVRFYLNLLDEAGYTYSPQFKVRGARGPRRVNNSARRPREDQSQDGGSAGEQNGPPPGMLTFPIPFHGKAPGSITVPVDFSADDVPMVDAAIHMLKVWAKVDTAKASK